MMTLEFFLKNHNTTSLSQEDDTIMKNQMLTLDYFLKKKESEDDNKIREHQEELEEDNSFIKNQLLALDFFLKRDTNFTESNGDGNGDGEEVNKSFKYIFFYDLMKITVIFFIRIIIH